jgi:rare lipoprotein A
MHELTAAHRTLPLGTRLLVTNLDNGQAVEVRVNDRGPWVDGRILDLSYAAAQVLGGVGPGVIPVRIRVLVLSGGAGPGGLTGAAGLTVQVGAFTEVGKATALRSRLEAAGRVSEIVTRDVGDKPFYKVLVGRYASRDDAYAAGLVLAGDEDLDFLPVELSARP